ncbi:hypothetical protein F2Q68_00010577 [Brassica cretica]|uniref:Uncharacterized protein n=1 Tax=Brassica cretica TaxID=69181 RepID=A0A8S9L1F0_BRACR|nr:hypothetical protein F2Q68_00010577 [Brassica cretica]
MSYEVTFKSKRNSPVEPSNELFTFVDCSQRNSGGIVRDLEVQIGNALVPVDFHVLDIKLNWNSSLLLVRAFLSTVGASRSHRRPPGESMIHESLQLATVEWNTRQKLGVDRNSHCNIDRQLHQKSTDTPHEESVDSSPDDWENDYFNPTIVAYTRQNMHTEDYDADYEEERATEYKAILDEEDTLLHHSSWKRNAPSIDINPPTSIDVAHTTSIDIHSKPDPTVSEKDKFDNEYLTPDEFGVFRDPDGYARAVDGRILNVSRKDIADILQTTNGAENLFVHQRNIPKYQQKDTKEIYDTAGGIDKSFKQGSRHPTRPSIDVDVPTSVDRRPEFGRRAFDFYVTRNFYWEEKNEYGVYRDDHGYARDLEGRTIRVHNRDIRRLLERASRDGPSYICLPEIASLFTQTKLVPEIYTKDEINEMFYGVCGAQEKYEGDFQMKLDCVYHPLNDSIGWLTTCMEEMRQVHEPNTSGSVCKSSQG